MPKLRSPELRALDLLEDLDAALWERTRACFESLHDPRAERGKRHPLSDVLLIALIAMIGGADDADEIALWAEEHQDWLSPWFELSHGTPSQDTFLRVFALLDPKSLHKAFTAFSELLFEAAQGGHVAIDGKTLRGSFDTASGKKAIHLVNAWLNELGVVLGQVKTDTKSNEITAIPELLEQLRLDGCTVSIDAAGCQREIARVIAEQNADYVLAVKGNQPTLQEDILRLFREARDDRRRSVDEIDRPQVTTAESTDSGHGRLEKRTASLCRDLSWLTTAEDWPNLAAVGMVECESTHELSGKQSTERRVFITSAQEMTAERFMKCAREHWGIETSLHWVLDVDFGEHASRIRSGYAAENIAVIRKAAMNLLKHEKSDRRSLKLKRKRCSWNYEYLKKVLGAAEAGSAK